MISSNALFFAQYCKVCSTRYFIGASSQFLNTLILGREKYQSTKRAMRMMNNKTSDVKNSEANIFCQGPSGNTESKPRLIDKIAHMLKGFLSLIDNSFAIGMIKSYVGSKIWKMVTATVLSLLF